MNKLETAVNVYRLMKNEEISDREVIGNVPESEYVGCKAKLERYDLLHSFVDECFQLKFQLPSESDALFVESMASLLEAPTRLLASPRQFYLADIDYLLNEEEVEIPRQVENYLYASSFASTLNELADHSLPSIPKAIFLQGEKLELSLAYCTNDLVELKGLDKFIEDFVRAEIHKEQKATIIKGVLIEMLKNNEIDRLTLPCLIKRFTEFLERVNANYQLYVSEFSFEKIKEQVESEKFEFTLKLNKVFSGIQNQLLAVPIALVLVSSQMQMTEGLSLKNMSIWFGIIIFGVFMSLLIRNQRSTLKAIQMEIDSQWSNIKNKHQFVAERLNSSYLQLIGRQRTQRWFLMIVSLIVAGSILAGTILLLHNSHSLHLYTEVIYFGVFGAGVYVLICLVWWLINSREM